LFLRISSETRYVTYMMQIALSS